MTRRELFFAAAAATGTGVCSATARESAMAVEGYIFQQYAESLKRPLAEVMERVIAMARAAGFRNVELSPAFFEAKGRERTLELIRSQGLRMPSLYVGGSLHERQQADRTIATALEFGNICAPFGCKAIVNNPDPKRDDAAKTDAELNVQADSLNRMGRILGRHGFELRVHHHTPQLTENAREWRHILRNTDPRDVFICVDVDWAYEAGFDAVPFLREVGPRLREIHVRSARNRLWLEDLEDSDIDYRKVAAYLRDEGIKPLIVVELAYRPNTIVSRPLDEDLRISRRYAERIFGVKADA